MTVFRKDKGMIIQNANNLIFYSTKDVSTILKCSKQTAQEIMRVYGFKLGKNYRISEAQLLEATKNRNRTLFS